MALWMLTIPGAALLGSLAWSGHGRDGNSPGLHLLADIFHLIAAGAWPTGLLPFSMILFSVRMRGIDDDFVNLIMITRRFSTMSLICVGLIAVTGIVNSCFLLASAASLISTFYGRVLCVKIALLLAIVALGAINLLYLKPRLASGKSNFARKLQMTVGAELTFAVVVVVVVSVLGTLPPG
jgi:copper resistance protein D